MTDKQGGQAKGSDRRFVPEWVREQVEDWLAEELHAHPHDLDAATVAVLERVKGEPRMVRAVGEAWSRGAFTKGVPQQDQVTDTVSPLVAQLDRLREDLSGGRTFPCAAEVIREAREEREAAR